MRVTGEDLSRSSSAAARRSSLSSPEGHPLSGMMSPTREYSRLETRVLPVDIQRAGAFTSLRPEWGKDLLGEWIFELSETDDARNLVEAAAELRDASVPVAFPTETVYGLGASAFSPSAVQGIYGAKRRPADNPLIVHVCCLQQLRSLLQPAADERESIPAIYLPLIRRFWPGPLTLILPLPEKSLLAPQVTAGLRTFGARMPSSPLALALIKLADVPLAAPSANASGRPSPTAASHVLHDLDGRISTIVDGGVCTVGVESTVVDGLSSPPAVLRPGGVPIEQIRSCPGWADVAVGYKDEAWKPAAKSATNGSDGYQNGHINGTMEITEAREAEADGDVPRAPGMKHRHYTPNAKVILLEHGLDSIPASFLDRLGDDIFSEDSKVGILRTHRCPALRPTHVPRKDGWPALSKMRGLSLPSAVQGIEMVVSEEEEQQQQHRRRLPATAMCEMELGEDNAAVARNLFAGLRDMDRVGADVVLVEAVDPASGEEAAAIMNRLTKAAVEFVRRGGRREEPVESIHHGIDREKRQQQRAALGDNQDFVINSWAV